MWHNTHQEHPECVDAHRHRDRIDHGRVKDGGGIAIKKIADAQVGIDPACEREHAKRDSQSDFKALNAFAQRCRHKAPVWPDGGRGDARPPAASARSAENMTEAWCLYSLTLAISRIRHLKH